MLRKKLLAYIYYIQNKMQLAWFIGNPCNLSGITNTLINNYKILGNSEQKIDGFDYDTYTPVEYLQSSGEQYIDTGISLSTISSNPIIEMTIVPTKAVGETFQTIFGCDSGTPSANVAGWFLYQNGNNQLTIAYGTGATNPTSTTVLAANQKYIIKIDKNQLYIDGTLAGSCTTGSNFGSKNITLFTRNSDTILDNIFNGSFYYCKIWNDTNLVGNFIPCYRNSDNVAGMYDTVTSTFFTNAGSGTFTVGSTLPTPTTPVEIKSIGDKTSNLLNYTELWGSNSYYNSSGVNEICTCYDISVPNGTYTISTTCPYASGTVCTVFAYNGHFPATFSSSSNGVSNEKTLNITVTGGILSIGIRYSSSAGYTTYTTLASWEASGYTIMVNEGSTAESYVPYGYEIPVKVSSQGTSTTTNIYLDEPLRSLGTYHALPSGYTELEYIQSSGTQYIDTGISNIYTDDTWYLTASSTSTAKSILIGNSSDWNGTWFGVYNSNWTSNENSSSSMSASTKTDLTVRFVNDGTNPQSCTISSGTTTWTFTRSSVATVEGTSICLFRSNRATYSYPISAKLYAARLVRNSVNVINLIPAKRNSDSAIGMYDLVTNTFFTNAGTGTFTAGPAVYADYIDYASRKVIRQVGYREFDGTESWGLNIVDTSNYMYKLNLTDREPGPDIGGMSSHFVYVPYNQRTDLTFSYRSDATGLNIDFIYNTYTTVNTWKSWLAAQKTAGTPVTVAYPLAIETEETVTLPQLSVPLGSSTVTVETEVQPNSINGIQVQGYV